MYFTVPVIVEVDTIWVNGQNVTEHVTAKIEGDKLIITDDRYSQTQEQDYSLAPELMKPYDLEFSEFVLRDSSSEARLNSIRTLCSPGCWMLYVWS